MNPEVGSIMSFFHNLFPVKVYTKEVPENFVVPSFYFPTPFSFDSNDTTSTFMKTYNLPVKLFHKDAQQANSEAERIADTVRRKRMLIPLINPDGSGTGKFIRITRIETRITEGVASIIVNWDSRYHYDREDYVALENFKINNGVKKR
ncbi:phage portal protein [Sporosarcina sp. resist]|uniref:phage tail terminator family protein n=1 Tax=Sporosarcina sp. resist TaxID=2762563 RepID=UPI00164E1356|nr:phage portal protein [Sporosarcina sp. resist]QNK87749.1 phage portal protein [Sporosarcina sp. resist]